MLGLQGSDRQRMDMRMVKLQYSIACSLWSQWLTMSLQKLHTVITNWDSGAVPWSMVAIFGQGHALPPIHNALVVMCFSRNPNRSVKYMHLLPSLIPP